MSYKYLILAGFILLGLTGVAAQNTPAVEPVNDTVTPSADLPGLPGQASDTARQVINTIQNVFRDGVTGLGDALRNLFQNREALNQTQKTIKR